MKRLLTITILSFLIMLAIGNSVNAQRHFRRDFCDSGRKGMMKNIENLRLLKLLEVLDLNDEQNDLFISAFSKFRRDSRLIREKVESEIAFLAEYMKQAGRSDDVILEKVDSIVVMKENLEKERTKFFEKIKDILTAEQLGKMMVFQERFERELLEQVRGFRAPKPPGMPDPNISPKPQPSPDFPKIDN